MAIRVMVVDDKAIYRKILSEVVESINNAELVGTALSGPTALMKLAFHPCDVVLLDVQMTPMDGVETLKKIKQSFPGIDVIMVSEEVAPGSREIIDALSLGALDFIRKPLHGTPEEAFRQLQSDLTPVLHTVKTKRRAAATPRQATVQPTHMPARPHASRKPAVAMQFEVVVVGVSTGGPSALSKFIPLLPADFCLPVLIVQHMPPEFTLALAKDLSRRSALHIREAADGDRVLPGQVLIAPGGRHMAIYKGMNHPIVAINDGPSEHGCRPAADVLFRSVAKCYGKKNVLAVIMTGMGSDGKSGVERLKQGSCYCLSQSEATCSVYGMPKEVDEAGLSDESVDLGNLAMRVIELAQKKK